MSILERPEIASFIKTWRDKPEEQVVEELASYFLETKRIPDPYHFLVTANGELFSPSAHCNVEDVVLRINHVGQLEYQALRFIEQWAAESDEGAIVWVSPPHPGIYPTSKVIISEIEHEGGIKKLFNRAIVFNFDEKKCLEFAQSLARYSQNRPLFTHLDEVRSTPIILNTRIPWIHILAELIDDPALWENIRNGDDQRAKKEAIGQARVALKDLFAVSRSLDLDDARIAVAQMLGPESGSCPVVFSMQNKTAFQVFSEGSLAYGDSGSKDPDFCRTCPVCQENINCIVRAGGSCPKCGVIKRCG